MVRGTFSAAKCQSQVKHLVDPRGKIVVANRNAVAMSPIHNSFDIHPEPAPDETGHHSERAQPSEPVTISYQTNRICLTIAGKQYWLTPSASHATSPLPAELAELMPFHYLSGWNPGGDRFTFAHNQQLHSDLVAKLCGESLETFKAVAVAKEIDWFEGGLALKGLTNDQAHRLAVDADQEGTIRFDEAGMHFIPRIGVGSAISLGWQLSIRDNPACPVRTFDAPAVVCSAHGGPWVERSRAALALWREHRNIGLRLLGCGACANGSSPIIAWGERRVIDPAAGLVGLREVMVGSRHGGYCWGGYTNR